MAPTHQRQGPPGALTAPPGGLQHLPDECPQQAAPSIPAPYGHLTLTRTAPGPDSSGQGWGWGGRGAGDLPLSPALPAQGTWGECSPSTSQQESSQTRGSSHRAREFRGAHRAAPSLLESVAVSPVPIFPSRVPCQLRSPCLCCACREGLVHALWLEGSRGRLVFTGVTAGTRVPAGDFGALCQHQSRGTADELPVCPEQQETGTVWAARAASAASAAPAAARAPRAPMGRAPASSLRMPG